MKKHRINHTFNNKYYLLWLLFFSFLLPLSPTQAIEKPAVMHAQKFQPNTSIDVTKYWISEKLDGVRARWTGKQLISRNGTLLYAPTWFTKNFPPVVLDGELWIARDAYQETVSIISQHTAHLGWKKIKFMIFDLPKHQGTFSARVAAMQATRKTNRLALSTLHSAI